MAAAGDPNHGVQPEPWLQRLYDRPFVLLALGLIVMFGFYTIWGLFEIMNMPTSTLP